MLSSISFWLRTNLLIYGSGSLIITITLIALLRNLFCRKPNDIYNDKLSKLAMSRNNSRSYADYSRSSKSNRSHHDYIKKHKSSDSKHNETPNLPRPIIANKTTGTPTATATPTSGIAASPTIPSKSVATPTPTPIHESPTPTSPIAIYKIPQFAPFAEQNPSHTASSDTSQFDIEQRKNTNTTDSKSNNKRISISINISNLKLPRLSSIASRPTSILKNVLRKMEYAQYDSRDIHLLIRSTSVFGCFGFLLSLLTLTTYYITITAYLHLIYSALLLYAISKFIIYTLSLFRLYFALNNSVLQYSFHLYVILIILLIMDVAVFVIFCALLYLHKYCLSIYCAMLFFVLDVVYIWMLYLLFTKRMFELFENTSSYIAKSKAKAYHHNQDAFRSTYTQSFDMNSNPSSVCNTPRDTDDMKSTKTSIDYGMTNRLSIQIERIERKPVPLKTSIPKRVKSYSSEVADHLTLQSSNSFACKDSASSCSMASNDMNNNRSLSDIVEENVNSQSMEQHKENIQNKREGSKSKRDQKREKWKHYQQQQASGIEYVTRYSVLVLLSTVSSLSMVGVLMYEQHRNFDALINDIDNVMELHIMLCADMVINCITVYFYFIFGKWLYDISCCLCHLFVQRCCVSLCI